MKRLISVVLLGTAITACSGDSSGKIMSVTAPSGENNILYWQDKTDLVRGVCVAGKPINRANCVAPMIKLAVADVTKRAMDMGKRGIDTFATAIAAEIKALKDSDPTVASLTQQIAALTQQKAGVEESIAAATTLLDSDRKMKAQIDEQLIDDNQQLKLVEMRLRSTPNDQSLLDLQRQLKIEILQFSDKTKEITERMQLVGQRLAAQQKILTKVETDLTTKQDELKKYADALDVYSPKLQQLRTDQSLAQAKSAAVPKVIEYIGSADVMFRGTIWPQDLQGALTIVERAFGGLFMITPGRYIADATNFCPQSVEVTADVKLKVNFLSPCTGGVLLTCENEFCSNTTDSFKPTVTIIDASHYEYTQYTTTKGIFALDKPTL